MLMQFTHTHRHTHTHSLTGYSTVAEAGMVRKRANGEGGNPPGVVILNELDTEVCFFLCGLVPQVENVRQEQKTESRDDSASN